MKFLVFFILTLFLAACAVGQSTTQISRRCAGASPSPARSTVEVQRDGDIDIVPCFGRLVLVNGSPLGAGISSLNALTAATQTFAAPIANDTASWASATSIHTLRLPITAVSGSARTNFFPHFNAQNTLAKSPYSWDGSSYLWTSGAGSTFNMSFEPDAGLGIGAVFTVGNGSSFFTVNGTAGEITANSGIIAFNNDTFQLNRTITAGGTTGNRTISKPAGTVNFAAGTSAITVTNSTAAASSIVYAIARTNDATCSVKNVVPGAGSFVINMTANCTAETSVGFLVTN